MNSTENSRIRIPFTSSQKFCLVFVTLLTIVFSIAAMIDIQFLLGIIFLFFPWIGISNWIGLSAGKIEFTSPSSYIVKSRCESIPHLYDGDNWERNVIPTVFHLDLSNTGYRLLDNRLDILTPTRVIFLGSGEKMFPIRDWLVQHGMQPK